MHTKNKICVAGNWKMNFTLSQAEDFAREWVSLYQPHPQVEVKIAPAYPFLYPLSQILKNTDVALAAQNMHWADRGAYTGEVSAAMLLSVGVRQVILGHSERRQYFGETGEILRLKVRKALDEKMTVIYCVGETEDQRENGLQEQIVGRQLSEVLFDLEPADWEQIYIAYEPVWAIGTGKTATPEQADQMHAFIRRTVAGRYGEDVADRLMILYGGSVKPANAAEIFARPNVDGGLVGGASLKVDSFLELIRIAGKIMTRTR